MKYRIGITLITVFCLEFNGMAQDRLKSGRPYAPGESFSAPLYGLNVTVPEAWNGYYPQDSEIFMMASDTSTSINCMYFANQTDLKKIASNWKKGFPLASGLSIELEGKISDTDGMLSANVVLTNRTDIKGKVLARCGEFGMCVSALVYGQATTMEFYLTKLEGILSGIEFVRPVPRSELDTFDWQKELTGKYLFAYQREQSSKKESQVWLYLDGTFKSKISRTGMFKGSAGKYKGTKKGSYLLYNEDKDQPAKLVLLYKGLPEVTLVLESRDNQYYINDQVFYYSAQ